MKTLITKCIPKTVRKTVRRRLKTAKDLMLDALDLVLGRHRELIPPRRLMFVGDGEFRTTGNEFLGYLKQLAELQPEHRVLDVGCGIGRMAVPLLGYLSNKGSYEGFDIAPYGIQWCAQRITPEYPNFRFQLADIRNREYNPDGQFAASQYRFPYESDSFDLTFLTSVFTHMLPAECSNYLTEVQRVLKPGGRCLITWFLLNAESERLIGEGKASLDFRHPFENCLTNNPTTPEEAICYRQEFVLALYERLGFAIKHPIHYGGWCGRERYLTFQDVCIAQKPPVAGNGAAQPMRQADSQ